MKKEAKKKSFGELFGLAWQDFKSNFSLFLKIALLLYLIPQLISLVASYLTLGSFSNSASSAEQFLALLNPVLIIIWIMVALISVLMSLTFIYVLLFNKKNLSVGDAIGKASKFYWRYLGLTIVLTLALIGLFILLIVPGIIFMIYWVFATLIIVYERKGIIESLKASKALVRKRWWRVFGFWILITLIVIAISIGIGLIGNIFKLFSLAGSTGTAISSVLGVVVNMFNTVITSLLAVAFFKWFYFDLKETMKGVKK